MTCYTAIFGKYDELKEPFIITPGWKYLCYTDQDFKSDVWEIIKVPKFGNLDLQRQARYFKINFHKFIQDEYSIWIDGTFFINCDLNEWWKQFKAPFTTIRHPFDICVYKDIDSCRKLGKGSSLELIRQEKFYRTQGLPENNGLISSGILMRQKTHEVIRFCEEWWEQLEKFSARDQIGFGYVNFKRPDSHYSIDWDYTYMKEFIHIPHLNRRWREGKLKETIEKYGKVNPS